MHACRAAGFGEETRDGSGLLEVSEEASPRTLGTRKNWKPEGRWGTKARLPVDARKFFRHPCPSVSPLYSPLPSPRPRPLASWAGRITCSFEGCLVQAAPGLGARAFSAVHWVVEECGASETLMRREPPTHPCSLPSMGNSAALSRVASAGLSTCSPYIMPGRGASSSRWVWTGQTGSVPAVVYPISKDLALLSYLCYQSSLPRPQSSRRNQCEPQFCIYGTTSFCDG